MSATRFCLLVVAKAPVPGLAKTRLCPPATPAQAADLAAAALLDTLDTVFDTPGAEPVIALTGDLARASRGAELATALRLAPVIDQRGADFGERLANAHADAAILRPGLPILQIGMDTPQVTPRLLTDTVDLLAETGADAALGPAEDGGWWSLALRDPAPAAGLAEVPMSRPDTALRTREMLERRGSRVAIGSTLSDVDTMDDARRVAESTSGRFAVAVNVLIGWFEAGLDVAR